MQNVQIQEVSSHKHLGLYFSNDCSWHQHIDYIKQKAWFRIHIMRKLKFKLDRKSLETIYLTFIRPLLEYGDVIWDNCTQYEKNELDKIQNEAARITTGTTKLVSLDNLYKEVGWQTLHRRRQDHKITLFYKMFNQLIPVYLSPLIPQQVNAISHHKLRNSNDIHTIRSNTSLYHNSFLPSTLRQWNSLPVEVRQLNTLSSFKTFLKKDLQSVPTYYYCGSRKAQILHARLRTGCSSLNMDLFHKNITESPLCRCGSIEDTQHYFFHCRFYQGPRNTLLNACSTYQNPSLSLFLFGSSTLSLEANIAILEHVHKYILDTKRFTLIKYHATLGRYIHMYTYTTGFQPSHWSVVSTLIPNPYPCPNQSDIPSLYDDVIIFFFFLLLLYLFIMFSQSCMFFCFFFRFLHSFCFQMNIHRSKC